MGKILTYTQKTFKRHCNTLIKQHKSIQAIHNRIGYPPYWQRPNTFESLVKIILEQQVSLASAHATHKRLIMSIQKITPQSIINYGEQKLKTVGITRQKANYIFLLAQQLQKSKDFLTLLELSEDAEVYKLLTSIKGFGAWSANVYLLTVLNRINIYPHYDVALQNGISAVHFKGQKINNDEAYTFMQQYQPIMSIAVCYYYWHYINERNIVFIV